MVVVTDECVAEMGEFHAHTGTNHRATTRSFPEVQGDGWCMTTSAAAQPTEAFLTALRHTATVA